MFLTDKIELNEWGDPLFLHKNITVTIARLDKVHPVISGNKLFKLKYFLDEALKGKYDCILTFGGAYSNHLLATAYACKQIGTHCIGVVRGDDLKENAVTLQQCESYGMQLHFISREQYQQNNDPIFIKATKEKFGRCFIIPEGGYHQLGALGASTIIDELDLSDQTYIVTALGTATTTAGLLMNGNYKQHVIAVPVLKNMHDIENRIDYLTQKNLLERLIIFDNYHFGGYAKKTPTLIDFMNLLYHEHGIETDFVYTAKMMFAIKDKIDNNYFKPGSKIICLHTGGLQGNRSLSKGTLIF